MQSNLSLSENNVNQIFDVFHSALSLTINAHAFFKKPF